MLALDANRDEDARFSIEGCREKVDNFAANIVSELALVWLFPLGHELVHSAGKSVHNSAL